MKFNGEDVTYMSRYGRTKIWGGYFLENLMQALARCIIGDNMLEISARNFVATMTHDEIVSLAPIADAERDFRWQQEIMRRPVSWAPDLPLAVDGGYAREYSK
jgi:DNA polymerase